MNGETTLHETIGPAITRDVTIVNRKGLHARPAAKIVKLCANFQCDIVFMRNDLSAPGRSILDLLMLAASQGKSMTILCAGTDANEAMDALTNLIARGFDEDDCACDDTALQNGCCSD